LHDAEAFFGKGAEGLAKVIEKAFKENGRPNGYVMGEEAAGAFAVGLIYGDGTLVMKNAQEPQGVLDGAVDRLRFRRQCRQGVRAGLRQCPSRERFSSAFPQWTAASTTSAAWASTTSGATASRSRRSGSGVGLRAGASIGLHALHPEENLQSLLR